MKNKILKTLFYSCLIGLSLNASELIKPKSPIIDIGYTTPQKSYSPTISPDWVYYSALTRVTDRLIQTKERVLSEKFNCEIDSIGRENCSIQQVNCIGEKQTDVGVSIKNNKTIFKNKVKLEGSTNINDVIEGDRILPPTGGSISGSLFTLKYKDTGLYNTQMMFNDGYQKNGKFALKAFNYGSGAGGLTFHPAPDKITVIVNNGATINPGSILPRENEPNETVLKNLPSSLIFTTDGKFATVLLEWNSIPKRLSYFCDDYCMVSKPDDLLGILNWVCPVSFVDADGVFSAEGKCKKEYIYYDYKCKTDTNNYEVPWVGPVVSAGGDCSGECGPYGCECNSSTSPQNNCTRENYTCPFDSEHLCTRTTDDKSSIDNVFNGYIYENGTAETFFASIKNDKSCPGGIKIEDGVSTCTTDLKYECLIPSFLYSNAIGECTKPLECNGTLNSEGKCVEEAIAGCPNGYVYDKQIKLCASNPVCDKGSFNQATQLCYEEVQCPKGFVFLQQLDQFSGVTGFHYKTEGKCIKEIDIDLFYCEAGIIEKGFPSVCKTPLEVGENLFSGEIKRTWFMCDTCVSNSTTRNILYDEFKRVLTAAGATTMNISGSGSNYSITHNSKKNITISLSTGGLLSVTPGQTINIMSNGFKTGNTITGIKPLVSVSVDLSCKNVITVPETENTPAFKKCADIPSTYSTCEEGYIKKEVGSESICVKEKSECIDGYKLNEDKTSCVKVLECDIGYRADYEIGGCLKLEPGYEMDFKEYLVNHYLECLGGVIGRVCSYSFTCQEGGKFETGVGKCVALPDFSCPNNVIADCEQGSYYKDGKCIATPSCEKGIYDFTRNVCIEEVTCDSGFSYDKEMGKCIKEKPFKNYYCLNGETLMEGEIDVCRIIRNGTCPSGYKVSLNASYCERSIVCPAEYPKIDYKNNKCFREE